jgi:hypothetical protein
LTLYKHPYGETFAAIGQKVVVDQNAKSCPPAYRGAEGVITAVGRTRVQVQASFVSFSIPVAAEDVTVID